MLCGRSHSDRPHEAACRQSMDEPMIFGDCLLCKKKQHGGSCYFVPSKGEKITEGFGENRVSFAGREWGTEFRLTILRSENCAIGSRNLSMMD